MHAPLGKADPAGGAAETPRQAPVAARDSEGALEELRLRQATHPFWEHRLLVACRQGQLTREDFAPLLSQYYLYCRAAERCLHALLANCERDAARERLSALTAEEHAVPPAQRPLELFGRLLHEGLGVDVEGLRCHAATRHFARECLDFCMRGDEAVGSAFLALGIEAVRPRLYSVFVEGLLRAGVAERHLRYFHGYMAMEGSRARELEALLLEHAHAPGWYAHSLRAMERALELRGAFFDNLFDAVSHRRVGPLLARIQAAQPLAPERPEPSTIHREDTAAGAPAVRSVHEERGIDYTEERVSFPGEVLEARLLRVAPGHGSDARQHAHETLLAVLSGMGRVRVNATEVEVRPGQLVFVPRWAWQQAHNTGETELKLLVVTDQGLAARAHVSESLTARLTRAGDEEG